MSDCNYSKDCSKVPIRKKCVTYCLERILRNATIEEKQLILGLDRDLSLAIFNAYNGFIRIRSFDDLRLQLTDEQVDALLVKFELINQYQLNYFNKSPSERASIVNSLRNLRLDSDDDLPLPR